MRIISGTHRGKIIRAPHFNGVRPTTDFAKTGLFNMLTHRFTLNGITVIDLFCGTGNIAYEFMSRGAKRVTSVDNNPACIRFVRKMAESLGYAGLVAVKEEVMSFLKSNRESSQVLFADPPYEYDSYDDLLGAMCVRERLTENGMVVLEHASRVHFNEHPNFVFERKYGQSAFSFFGAVPGNPPAL